MVDGLNTRRFRRIAFPLCTVIVLLTYYFAYFQSGNKVGGLSRAISWPVGEHDEHGPRWRTLPRAVPPVLRFHEHVDLGHLVSILSRLRPFSPKPKASIAMSTHALRLWGSAARFREGPVTNPALPTGAWQFSSPTMLSLLLDGDVFAEMYPGGVPLLTWQYNGVFVRTYDGRLGERPINVWPDCEYHCDKVISVLAEIGVPSDYPVRAEGKAGRVADILRGSARRFSPRQELDFTAKAFLYYLEFSSRWNNRQGNPISIDQLLDSLGEFELGAGACLGIHKCQVMALALRIDETESFLSHGIRARYRSLLKTASESLCKVQDWDGSWPPTWFPDIATSGVLSNDGELATRLRVVGHHLEWIAIAPPDVCPPDYVVMNAIRYLQRTMSQLPPHFYYEHFALLTHAGRALVLLANEDSARLATLVEKL